MLAPQLAHRKRGQSEVFARTSSIAGTVYNSSAVYKRLKPSTCSTSTASELGNTGLRPQGRPFSSNITGRFLLHDDMISLLRYMNKKNTQRLACYDFRKADDDGTKNSTPGTGSVASTVGEDTVQSTRSSPGMCSGRTGSASSPRTHRKSAPCKFEDISLDVFVSDDPVLALDSFFSAKHCAIKLLDDSGPVKSPSQHTITHNPPVQTQSLMSNSSTGTSSPSPSSPGSVKIESPDVSGMQTPSTNPGKRSPHALNFILNNSVTTVSSPKKADDHQNEANVNFHKYIVDAFGIKEYQFIKAIRDSNGHILKLESIRPPRNSDHEIEYSAEWVKKAICYPRYKGGMKIHLVRDDQSFILYNDLKMMLWDIKQEDSIVKDAIPLQHIEVDHTVRDSLFGGRMVYVKIA
ncbi:DEKNAAC100072 [Brettanomyces naardenensis]|uniref:DEKNAAC100072 n=1 Tax=Brettanomyces naardenensis TaxID=13370 RepID=A0A448YG43_BRENA|nr:DEKNAAC100072 [Brettanomyces naardenensis]